MFCMNITISPANPMSLRSPNALQGHLNYLMTPNDLSPNPWITQ